MVSLNAAEYDTLCRVLGDTPETVIAVHLLQLGLCSAYAVGEIDNPDAIVIQPNNLPEEPTAFGTNAEAIFRVLRVLPRWTCVNTIPRSHISSGRSWRPGYGDRFAITPTFITPWDEPLPRSPSRRCVCSDGMT